jgi:hypothetical protein
MNPKFTIPTNLSFEQAIGLTQDLLDSNPSEERLESAIEGLIQTMNGSRGFFVTFLTGESSLADQPTEAILKALRSDPEAIADLMVKNIAMPTAMEITHQRNGNPDLAASSQLTQRRSVNLVQQLKLPEITALLQSLQETLNHQSNHYTSFLDRWGYDEEQRIAILQAVNLTLQSPSS